MTILISLTAWHLPMTFKSDDIKIHFNISVPILINIEIKNPNFTYNMFDQI